MVLYYGFRKGFVNAICGRTVLSIQGEWSSEGWTSNVERPGPRITDRTNLESNDHRPQMNLMNDWTIRASLVKHRPEPCHYRQPRLYSGHGDSWKLQKRPNVPSETIRRRPRWMWDLQFCWWLGLKYQRQIIIPCCTACDIWLNGYFSVSEPKQRDSAPHSSEEWCL